MADISGLGGLQPVEPLDLDLYPDVKGSSFQLPVKGRYTFRVRPDWSEDAFGTTKGGQLSISPSPTIVGPHNEGFNLKFAKVSAKVFQRGQQKASQAGDFLRSCGLRVKLDDNQAIADAAERTAGMLFEADLDWNGYDNGSQYSVEGMEKAASDGNGGYLPYFLHPTEKDENGDPLKIRARAFIARYIPQA